MATFPKAEPLVADLAGTMISGLGDNPEIYPTPPVATLDLITLTSAYSTAKNAAAAEAATLAKTEALQQLVAAMKSDSRYAENTVDFEDDNLKLIGWGGRKAPTPLTPPGQTLTLTVLKQGEGWVQLTWKAPVDGGKPSAYKVNQRERAEGPWQDVHTAVTTDATLTDQPRGKELEYRIIAVNKAGQGDPSNTQMVVL